MDAARQAWSAARSRAASSHGPAARRQGTKVDSHSAARPGGAQPSSRVEGKASISGGRSGSSPSAIAAKARSRSAVVLAESMKARSNPGGPGSGGMPARTASTFSSLTLRRPTWIRRVSAASQGGTAPASTSSSSSRRASTEETTARLAPTRSPPACTATARPPATSTRVTGIPQRTLPPAASRQRTSASTVAWEPPAGRAAGLPCPPASMSAPAPVPGSAGDCWEWAAQWASGAWRRSSATTERTRLEADPSSAWRKRPAWGPRAASARAASSRRDGGGPSSVWESRATPASAQPAKRR